MDSRLLLAQGFFGLEPDHLWLLTTGVVGNAACALVGCYLVLRRMSLLGDAISHSILAAIGLVFVVTGGAHFVPIFIGSVAIGVLTGFLTQLFHDLADVPEDTSMGVVFTTLFAAGVVIISQFPQNDLDVNCVLYGKFELLDLKTVELFGRDVPEAFLRLSGAMALTIAFVVALWKELKIASFDPSLATAMGISATVVHYLLLSVVAVVTVTSLESMGAIVVIAMLIVPAATAHLLTDRLKLMMVYSVLLSTSATVIGFIVANQINSTVSGMIAVAAGLQFAAMVTFAPNHGLVGKGLNNLRLRLRIVREDILSRLYRMEEAQTQSREPVTLSREQCNQLAGGNALAGLSLLLMRRYGQLAPAGGDHVQLTDVGRTEGRSLLRSHRLWESYLSKHFELDEDHLHEPAHRVEHYIGPKLQEEIEKELETSTVDPHGKQIPPAETQRPAAPDGDR